MNHEPRGRQILQQSAIADLWCGCQVAAPDEVDLTPGLGRLQLPDRTDLPPCRHGSALQFVDHPLCFSHMGWTVQQVAEHMADHPFSVNDIGHPSWQQAKRLGNAHAAPQRVVLIAQQWKVEVVACCKPPVAHPVVSTDAPDLGIELIK